MFVDRLLVVRVVHSPFLHWFNKKKGEYQKSIPTYHAKEAQFVGKSLNTPKHLMYVHEFIDSIGIFDIWSWSSFLWFKTPLIMWENEELGTVSQVNETILVYFYLFISKFTSNFPYDWFNDFLNYWIYIDLIINERIRNIFQHGES